MAIASRPFERTGFTVEDILAMPADGLKYELYDGMLIVNPPPSIPHQVMLAALQMLVQPHLVGSQRALPAPVGWRPEGMERWFEPDLVVFDSGELDPRAPYLTEPPLLVVEILSPSSRAHDWLLKRQAYEEGGIGAYWIIDLDPDAPSVTVLERPGAGATFAEVDRAVGEEVAHASHPWPVAIVPADLVR